jgi:hypothetical protein
MKQPRIGAVVSTACASASGLYREAIKPSRIGFVLNVLLVMVLLGATSAGAERRTQEGVAAPQATALGSAFTYQGQLKKSGQAYNGACDFQFSLHDAATGGEQVGGLLTKSGVNVADGVFAVKLDFGAGAFSGDARWLQAAVKCPGDERFFIFNARQELTPAPYALGLRLPLEQTSNSNNVAFLLRNNIGRGIVGVTHQETAVEGNSTNGDGLFGLSVNGRGVAGISQGNHGVYGESRTRDGVSGYSTDGNGLYGVGLNGNGVVGISTNRIGIVGEARTREGIHGYSAEAAGVYGRSDRSHGMVAVGGADGDGIYAETAAANRAGVAGINKGTGNGVFGASEHGYAGFFVGKVRVGVLEIAGGADLAEPFDVRSAASVDPAPGMVVCIDRTRSGELVVCTAAGDRTVAGVISGAGGVQPGMIMQQEGTAAAGQHPVALAGRVYVWADATTHPIQPGDLLTTSATAGHAQAETDHDARGAVLGKALTALPEGKGLVLLLVALN